MDDFKYTPSPMPRGADPFDPPLADPATGMESAGAPSAEPTADPAVEKFKSCRWKATPDQGDFCTHRDVLPFAGKEGFKPESWCPECAFYKLRRTPKKRERADYSY
ncbi:MAG: hypothetical protein ABIX28_18035 [Vicinamibacterales bacterium]